MPPELAPHRRSAAVLLSLLLPAILLTPSRAAPPPPAAAAFEKGLLAFDDARAHHAGHPAGREETARRYGVAAQHFVEAWKAGLTSTEVLTNAANAHHFAGAVGEAVLFYRRALAIDPSNRRARDGLEHIRLRLPIRRPAAGAAESIARSLFFWHEGLPFRTRKAAFLASFPAAFILLAAALRRRRPFLLAGGIVLLASLALLGSVLVEAGSGSIHAEAVVLVEVEGRRGDGPTYSRSHSRPFPPGTEVHVLPAARAGRDAAKSGGDSWLLVRLLDGSESWVPSAVIERVVP